MRPPRHDWAFQHIHEDRHVSPDGSSHLRAVAVWSCRSCGMRRQRRVGPKDAMRPPDPDVRPDCDTFRVQEVMDS